MDADSSVSETLQDDECQFLAMEVDDFLELDPVQAYVHKEQSGQSAVLVDVVTGSLFLSNSVSVSTDGPLTDQGNLSAPSGMLNTFMQTVQPVFINRTHLPPAAEKTVMGTPYHTNSFNSSRQGPMAFIAVGKWVPLDSAEGFPMSPTVNAFGIGNSLNSQLSALSGNVAPCLPASRHVGEWPAAPTQSAVSFQHHASSQAAGGPYSPAVARWLVTDDQNCRTPVATAAAVATPGAPMVRRLPRPL